MKKLHTVMQCYWKNHTPFICVIVGILCIFCGEWLRLNKNKQPKSLNDKINVAIKLVNEHITSAHLMRLFIQMSSYFWMRCWSWKLDGIVKNSHRDKNRSGPGRIRQLQLCQSLVEKLLDKLSSLKTSI
eukprot:snap_masked-scaffold_6-processed-gene-20.16-mRNA-1 protein AED:1.00 eAED:1.00 QI:0/0/0/0/1/1/2/0/128